MRPLHYPVNYTIPPSRQPLLSLVSAHGLLGLGRLLGLLLLQLLDLLGVVLGPLVPLVRGLARLGHLLEDGALLVRLRREGCVLAGEGDLEVLDVARVWSEFLWLALAGLPREEGREGRRTGGKGMSGPFALVKTRLMAPEQPLQLMATWYLNSCDSAIVDGWMCVCVCG